MMTSSREDKYAAPMPVIGMYIAAASSVCFILILCDLIHSIRLRKQWLPRKFFSLNSVTLTLLSICAKIPVDLTTSMPGVLDEYSKLTGTAFVCVCMGFILPSIGSNRDSECFTNMVALSILVITIVVNVSIEIATGLISFFVWENVVMMVSMLSMLSLLWFSTWAIKDCKEIHMDHKTGILKKSSTSMLQQLKLCYLHGYASNPQLALSESFFSLCSSLICFIYHTVLFYVFLSTQNSEDLFLGSDFAGSLMIIVEIQFIVTFLAVLATTFRWLAVSHVMDNLPKASLVSAIVTSYPYLKGDITDYFSFIIRILVDFVVLVVKLVITPVIQVIKMIRVCFGCSECTSSEGSDEYEYLSKNGVVLLDWALRKCIKDMKKMDIHETRNSLTHTRKLLSTRPPSPESIDFKGDASSLYLAFLVRIISVSAPSIPSGHLAKSLNEVFDIIQFVDNTMNFLGSKSKSKNKLAKAMWLGKDFSTVLPKIVQGSTKDSNSDLHHALDVIRQLQMTIWSIEVWEELDYIVNSITGREYATIEELYDYMEQLFVDMLHIFLSQLPCAIFKEVRESHVEEYEDRARRMLKFLFKVQSLENMVQWSFPDGSNITSLISIVSSADLESNADMGENGSDGDLNVGTTSCDDVIQVV